MLDIRTFGEEPIREAILNAVAHRDYHDAGSVRIQQFPRRIEIVSPGGFPPGVTPENILDRQQPRNRRIADTLGRCGLVERSGQGANRIFETSIREGKPLPDFTHTDAWQVSLTLHGEVQDPGFVKFLERVGRELQVSFDSHDLVVLDLAHREVAVPAGLRSRAHRLAELGVVESVGRGKGVRYLLSRRFYSITAKRGVYTRRRGLDRETNKELLLKHLRDTLDGSPISELQLVLPGISRANIQRLLDQLRKAGQVQLVGERRGAKWFSTTAPAPPEASQ